MSEPTVAESAVHDIQELDRLFVAAERSNTIEGWDDYRAALTEVRKGALRGFWKPVDKEEEASVPGPVQGTGRVFDALTKDPSNVSQKTLRDWKILIELVTKLAGTLENRLAYVEQFIRPEEESKVRSESENVDAS